MKFSRIDYYNYSNDPYICMNTDAEGAKMIIGLLETKVKDLISYEDTDYKEVKKLVSAITDLQTCIKEYEDDEKAKRAETENPGDLEV